MCGTLVHMDILTTAVAIPDPDTDNHLGKLLIVAPAAAVKRVVRLLNLQAEVVVRNGTNTAVEVRISTTDPIVAQAGAEAIARAVGHVIPTLAVAA
jgi:hypothetical protein